MKAASVQHETTTRDSKKLNNISYYQPHGLPKKNKASYDHDRIVSKQPHGEYHHKHHKTNVGEPKAMPRLTILNTNPRILAWRLYNII